MSKRFTALVALILFLPACGGRSASCDDHVQIGIFGICLQNEWEQVSEEKLREEGVPAETVAAFQLTSPRAGQRDNIVISRERLPGVITAEKYAQTNVRTIEVMPEYSLIEKREVNIDGEDTLLHIFTARPVPDLPARRFYQVSLVEGTTGYVVTGTLPFAVDSDIEEGLVTMVLSATLEE